MVQNFPKVKKDGSFCFEAQFIFTEPLSLPAHQVDNWIKEWIATNNPWNREWSSGRREVLYFNDEFLSQPKVVDMDEIGFRLKIEGKNEGGWKDWFVRITRDLIDSHDEIKELKMH